ncbi:MAG: hypothetical protein HY319_15770, partial [Armatimonadetes bacterium]|nr:hypothetical protein [Armatimonadota bacterium]
GPPPPAPSRYRQELFPWLDEVVLTALARDPQGRFEGAAQFRSALRHGHLLYGKGLTARMSRWLAPGTPGGRMAWLVAALLLMCGAGWSSRARLEGLHLGSLWVAGAASIPWLLAVTAAVGRPGRRRDWEAAACSLLVPGCEWRGPMSSVGSLVTAAQLAALLTIWCPLLSGQVGWGHPWSLLVAAAAWIAAARVGFLNCRRPRRGWSPSRIGLAVGILAVLGAAGIAPWLLPALAVITAALFGSPAGVACASPVTAARILWGEWDLGRGLLEFFVLATACSLAGMPGRTRALRTGGAALAPSLLALFLGNATPLFLLETWIGVGLSAACAAGRGRFWPRVRPGRRSRRR